MRADVVIPVYRGVEMTRACVDSVLRHSGPSLGRVILVDDRSHDEGMDGLLEGLRDDHRQVRLLRNEANLGFVSSANRGVAVADGHAVILNNDTRVTPGWLDELLGVLEEAPRVGAVCPLSNNATMCSVPDFGGAVDASMLEGRPLGLAGVPRWTELPTGNGFCMLMRREVIEQIGLFDPAFGRGYHEENDWCQRLRQQGYVVARANRALVFHAGWASFGAKLRAELDLMNGRRLVARYPRYLDDNRDFESGPHARVACRAVRASLGRLHVRMGVASRWSLLLASRLQSESGFKIDVVAAPGFEGPVVQSGLSLAEGGPADVLCAEPDATALPSSEAIVTLLHTRRVGWSRDAQLPDDLQAWLHCSQAVVVDTERTRAEVLRRSPIASVAVGVGAESLRAAVERAACTPDVSALNAQIAYGRPAGV